MTRCSVWLTFAKDGQSILDDTVSRIAKEHKSPRFMAHITVYGTIDTEIESLIDICKKISKHTRPFFVKVIGIGHSNNFWRTLFLELELNQELQNVYLQLEKDLKSYLDYEFHPHISIMYKNTTDFEKEKAKEKIPDRDSFLVESIAIHLHNDDVSRWKEPKKFSFVK